MASIQLLVHQQMDQAMEALKNAMKNESSLELAEKLNGVGGDHQAQYFIAPKRRGRPPGSKNKPKILEIGAASKHTKPADKLGVVPLRYRCPVPWCRGKAAPIFGMVCAKHRDLAKSDVKKFRDARRLKKH